MINDANLTPNNSEVFAALDRILASSHFKTSATQSKLLSFVVQKALAGEDIKAIHIMVELYGDSNVDIHRVKSTANHVRDRLAAYHISEGTDDLVQIELPPGPGYRAKCSYNLDGGAWRLLKQGAAAQQILTYYQLCAAAIAFDKAQRLMPNYAPVFEGKAENGLLRVIRNHIFGRESMHAYNERAGFEDAETALTLDRQSWRAHLVQGWMEGFAQGWVSAAADHFAKAKEFNEDAVENSLSYATFLVLKGSNSEAAKIVNKYLEAWPQNAGGSILAAFLIYLNRDYMRAIKILNDVRHLIGRSDVGSVVSVMCFVESGFAFLGVDMFEEIEQKLCHSFKYYPSLPGLEILCLVRAGKIRTAKARWKKMRRQPWTKPIQFAIAYMAFERHGRAIVCLRRAQRQGDIFTNLIHLIPLFDPLRGHPRFAQMVQAFADTNGISLS